MKNALEWFKSHWIYWRIRAGSPQLLIRIEPGDVLFVVFKDAAGITQMWDVLEPLRELPQFRNTKMFAFMGDVSAS